jgi:hypothetical protein
MLQKWKEVKLDKNMRRNEKDWEIYIHEDKEGKKGETSI